MKLLLDTHTFIWWDSEPERLSPAAMALCGDRANELILSAASLWEMQIKLLVAQAISEGAALVTVDPVFAAYPVEVRW